MSITYPRWITGVDPLAALREVHTGLYVGSGIAVCERPTYSHDWSGVVDCQGPMRCGGSDREYRFGTLPRVIRCGFDDGGDIPSGLLDAALRLVREAGGDVLVSCAAGMSRSPSVAYAILRVRYGMGHDEALARVSLPGDNAGPSPVVLASARRWAEEQR